MDSLQLYIVVSFGVAMLCDGYKRQITILTPPYPRDDSREVVKLGVILPFEPKYPWALSKTLPAIEYAMQGINNNSDLLTSQVLRITIGDSRCSNIEGPLVAIDMYVKRLAHVFVGPACDYSVAPIARFSSHWNIPLITGGAPVQAFEDKTQYSLLTRIYGSYAKLGHVFLVIFKKFKFIRAALIYADNLGKRAGFGKTHCYFVMESVFLKLNKPYKAVFGNHTDLWYKAFDEKQPGTYNLTNILLEASMESRGKTCTEYCTLRKF